MYTTNRTQRPIQRNQQSCLVQGQQETVNNTNNKLFELYKYLCGAYTPKQSFFKGLLQNNENLLLALKEEFDGDWHRLRDCLPLDNWPNNLLQRLPNNSTRPNLRKELMSAFLKMRQDKWNEFIDQNIENVLVEIRRKANENQTFDIASIIRANLSSDDEVFKINSGAGSTSLTSDIDLSTSGKYTELGISIINEYFRQYFETPYDSGTLFDINVYASDWLYFNYDNVSTRYFSPASRSLESLDTNTINEIRRSLLKWSLVKLRRNLTEEEWKEYKSAVPVLKKLVDKEYTNFTNLVGHTVEGIMSNLPHDMQPVDGNKFDYEAQAIVTRASNSVYENILKDILDLRQQIPKLSFFDREAYNSIYLLLVDNLAKSLTFANEVYATSGPVLHTVLAQMNRNAVNEIHNHIPGQAYLLSINENLGDALHSLERYKDKPSYAVYRSAKYLKRMFEAYEKICNIPLMDKENYNNERTINLREISTEADKIKKSKSCIGQTMIEGDPDELRTNLIFKNINSNYLIKFRKELLGLGAHMSKNAASYLKSKRT